MAPISNRIIEFVFPYSVITYSGTIDTIFRGLAKYSSVGRSKETSKAASVHVVSYLVLYLKHTIRIHISNSYIHVHVHVHVHVNAISR